MAFAVNGPPAVASPTPVNEQANGNGQAPQMLLGFVRCNWTQPWKISSAEALTTVRLEDALIDPEAHKGVPCSTVDASLGSAGRYDVDMVCCIMLYFKYIYNTL